MSAVPALTAPGSHASTPQSASPRSEGLPRTAAAIAVTAWGVVVLALVILVTARPPLTVDLWFFVVDAMVGCVYGLVAGIVLSRRRHAVPGVLAVTALGGAATAFAFAYGSLGMRYTGLPLVEQVLRLNGVAWVPGTLGLFLVVPWLVRDHRLGLGARAGLGLGVAVTVTFTVTSALDSPVPIAPLAAATVAVGLIAAADTTWRWARGPLSERVGLGWLAIGTAIMALSFVPLAVPAAERLPIWSVPVLHLLAQAFFPAAVLVAVLRQRMWGIDLSISRAVLGGVLTVVLVVVYVVVAAVIARLVPGQGASQVAAAAAVAVAVQPSRLWLQRRVQRLVHGEAADPQRAVRRLGAQLGSAQTTDELLDGLVASVAEALRLESAELVTADGVTASRGVATAAPDVVRLRHRAADVGELRVTAPAGEALDVRSRRALDELAAVVAAGVALARASRDLDDARDRLTTVRLQERRVIRRELHDGLGPSLAGIRLGLQAARNVVETDPAAAAELLATLQAELDHQVEDVRQLSRSLLPPVLDELGLAAALDDLAQRQREGGLEVRLDCSVPSDLPRDVAAAVYGVVAEAVTNVVRHAAAGRCWVAVGVVDDELVALVEDDGTGVAASAVAGVGTTSMRERAEEQGGTLTIEPRAPRGTSVRAQLPLSLA